MDLVDLWQDVFDDIRQQFEPVRTALSGAQLYFVPVVATDGDNIVQRSRRMSWFHGPCILDHLQSLPI